MQRLYLRRAVKEDSDLLLKWANDRDVRRNAFHSEAIEPNTHEAWFKGKLEDEKCFIYIAYVEIREDTGKIQCFPVGQVRLDVEEGVGQIDYSIAKEYRGKGYGTVMLRAVENICRKEAKDIEIKSLSARVKTENTASQRVFEKNGYRAAGGTDVFLEFEKDFKGSFQKPCIVICTHKSWNIEQAEKLSRAYEDDYDIVVITEKEKLTKEYLELYAPRYLFFPHWSYLIPEEVFSAYECVVFHMTDLPFGRGGSPLQNLIVRGFKKTKISALRVEAGLDTGDIYLKENLDLDGSADDILRRCSEIIFTKMIPKILEETIIPIPQSGEAVVFKRRKKEDGRLTGDMCVETMYDYIRMLDGEGYPNAYMEMGDYILRFSKAELKDGKLWAHTEFVKKEEQV